MFLCSAIKRSSAMVNLHSMRSLLEFIAIFLCWLPPQVLLSTLAGSGSSGGTSASGGNSGNSNSNRQWSDRVVTTKFGQVRGFLFQGRNVEGVEVFLGLPYASAPVGSLRLMPPVSGSPWSGTKMNEEPAPVCPQVFPNIRNETEILKTMPRGRLAQLKRLLPLLRNQSEDCLYLNLYVPLTVANRKAANTLLPVLVFVHGDDYGFGAGHPYDPSMFASVANIIVVTMNYRLGILGFLNANSDGYFKSPANFAMLDQIAALHWVQENIISFGGDRTNVTLMGHGKGGIFVNFLMISSAVPQGLLFHRVILMSGSALSPLTASLSQGKDLAKKFATKVNCPLEPPSTMLHCLREVPIQYFIQSELWGQFGPSDDGVIIEEGIRENLLRDRLAHYPLLFGVTKVEMLPWLSEHDAVYGLEVEKRREILKQFVEKYYSVHRNEIMAAAIHEYTDWERPVQHPISVRDETLDALADAQVVAPLIKVGDLHSQSNTKSYFYVFEYQSKVSDYQQRLGCVHTEDVFYVFGVPLYFHGNENSHGSGSGSSNSREPTGAGGEDTSKQDGDSGARSPKLGFFTGNFTRNEVQLSQTVMLYWANFVRTGNPNEEKGDGESSGSTGGAGSGSRLSSDKSAKPKIIEWPSYDPLYKKYLNVDTKPRIRTHYRAHKLSFWLHLVPDLQKNGYGVPNGHHNINTGSAGSSVPINPGGLPPHPNSGLVILPPEDTTHNSTTPQPPTIQLVGPPMWEHNPNKPRGNFFQGTGDGDSVDSDGFQMYSTALSVTIAIGCSLLILNILIFAAFYYQRDKRRAEESQNSPSHDHQHHRHHDSSGGGPMSSMTHAVHGGSAYKTDLTTLNLSRRKENGQIVQMAQGQQQPSQPMPNICGDLPAIAHVQHHSSGGSDSGGDTNYGPCYQQQNPNGRGTLKRNVTTNTQQQQTQQTQSYEMSMPDAVIAAAMMNVKFDNSPEYGSVKGSCQPRRSSLTMKDQLPSSTGSFSASGGCGTPAGILQYDSGSRTVPRPPKRTTPTVKFGPETSLESPSASGGSSAIGTGTGSQPGNFSSQTLKPSLKKSVNYSPTNADELRV